MRQPAAPSSQLAVRRIEEVLVCLLLGALVLGSWLGPMAASAFIAFSCLFLLVNFSQNVKSLLSWWPLLILPGYCLVSTLWSQFPGETLRLGVQLTFTLVVGIAIACRIPSATLLRDLFIVYGLSIIISLVFGANGGVAWSGIFGSKNAFASQIALFAVIATAVIFDKGAPRWMRWLAVAGVLGSGPLMLRAQSTGTLVALFPAIILVLGILLSKLMSDMQKLFGLIIVGLAAAFVALVLVTYGDVLLRMALEMADKDVTLTGRTDLWDIGRAYIAERPLTGVGYRAFWVRGYAPAEELWAIFEIDARRGFNFHNLYISDAVEIGLLGLGIEIAIIYLTAGLLAVLAVVRPTPAFAALAGLHALLILRSFLEVEVFGGFGIRSILVYVTLIYAAHEVSVWLASRRANAWRPEFASVAR